MQNIRVQSVITVSFFACLIPFSACGGGSSAPSQNQTPPVRAIFYYLDCSAETAGTGTSDAPWNSLASANGFAFQPGDTLLLKRGTTCSGSLTPQGSGKAGAPITIDAYGSGARPIIDAGRNEEGIRLVNQDQWEIGNLEVMNGDLFGVFVTAEPSQTALNHLYFRNLDIHGAHHRSGAQGDSGELFISVVDATLLNDVLIDGVSVHDSTVSNGIEVISGSYVQSSDGSKVLGTNLTIQNSSSNNIYGYGVLVMQFENVLVQNNVVHDTGLCPDCPGPGSATVGIGLVICRHAIMQSNESYANQTHLPYDGGAFGLEDAIDSIVQYNYGHDSMGYCIGHFAGPPLETVNNTIRYNVCSNNGQNGLLSYQGEMTLGIVSGGNSFNGAQIYNNTFFWNPPVNAPAIHAPSAVFGGTNPAFFQNNIVYSSVPNMIDAPGSLSLDHNIYWTTSGSDPIWQVDGSTFTGFAAYQGGTGKDVHSFNVDPMMTNPTYHEPGKPDVAFTLTSGSPAIGSGADVCSGVPGCSMGGQDFWGNPLPTGGGYSIGAQQPQ